MIQAETLALLEWQRLCQHLATFAATKLGAIAARQLKLPDSQTASSQLLSQTREIVRIEAALTSNWSFDGICDVGSALEHAERGGIIPGENLLEIATTLAGMRRLRRVIDSIGTEEIPVLSEAIADVRTYPELEQEIHYCIDDRGDVTERASPQLAGIRKQLKQVRDRIYQILHGLMQRQSSALQEAVITQRDGRFVLPVKAGQKDSVPGILHDTSSTGATLYVEPKAIVELGNQLRQLQRQEQREEEAVLRALTEKVAAVKPDLERLLAIATTLDLATARARYSLWLEANPPRFINWDKGENINLRNLRHPLLVWQQKHEQGSNVVPIDVRVPPQTRVVAITGPNTGGKTVALKTIALAALMARVGLYVPAREPVELPWFDRILADIGDEQSIEQSLSTFSGHVRRITRIIEALQPEAIAEQDASSGEPNPDFQENSEPQTERSESPETKLCPALVLLDEVGAGTDPAEGSAIAASLLQYLAERVLLTVATTHYGELKALKYQDDRFENASVEFDEATLAPTYRLLWGIPGRSNALSIARRLGLDTEIIERAREKMGGLSADINTTIAGLEAQRQQQEEKTEAARQLLQQAEQFYQEISDRAAALQAREQDLKRSQEQAVTGAIAEAKAEIAKVIRTLQQGTPNARDAQQATEAIDKIASSKLPKPEPPAPKAIAYKPRVGESVRLPRLGQTAEVLSEPDENHKLAVRFGLMKMTVSLADIESLDGKKAEVPSKPKSQPAAKKAPETKQPPATIPTVRTSQNTVDIRGSRVSDAESDLEQAIAKADRVLWIIHGKGTGRLREGVHQFLERHPQVSSFELATQKEGGAGVTIAYLH